MDYDVIVIGSGFGGAITSSRLAEAGCRVLVLERGRWWDKKTSADRTAYPRGIGDPWIWNQDSPHRENGWIDIRTFPNMTVVQGAAVGGGSQIYANVSVEAPPQAFERGWPAEITYSELKPFYERVKAFMNVQKIPGSQWTHRTSLVQKAATAIGSGERFRTIDLAVSFDPEWNYGLPDPQNLAHSKRFKNQQGVEQGTCVHLGNCDIGCDADAKNTLDRNYIPFGIGKGMEVRQLHVVRYIEEISGGYRVHFDRIAKNQLQRGYRTARIVIVSAGSLGSTELLLRCRDEYKTLPRISAFLGRNWSSNGDFLTPALGTTDDVFPSKGPTISAVIDFLDGSVDEQVFWVQDGGFPDVVAANMQNKPPAEIANLRARTVVESIQNLLGSGNPFKNVMPWFSQAVDAGDGVLRLRRPWLFFGARKLHLDWDITQSEKTIETVVAMHRRLAKATGGVPVEPPGWSIGKDLITPHPLGGCNLGTSAQDGVVDHLGQVFGYKNLYVADGSVIPEAIGVNPSRTIAALAERTAELMIKDKRL